MLALETTIDLPLTEAEEAVRSALAGQGFGVLTEIDVAATLHAKLGVERTPLKILGACNPTLAHTALELDSSVALVLPCNVVLEPWEMNRTRVRIVDPHDLIDDPRFTTLADDAAQKLQKALDDLSQTDSR
jgi:uncharacterized protein (DUF302 family)